MNHQTRTRSTFRRGIGKPLVLGGGLLLVVLVAGAFALHGWTNTDAAPPVDATKLQGASLRSAPKKTTETKQPESRVASVNVPANATTNRTGSEQPVTAAPVAAVPPARPTDAASAGKPTVVNTANPPAAGEYLALDFKALSDYEYETPDPADVQAAGKPPKNQIPEEVKALSGKKVAIQGFVIPLEMKDGHMVRFILTNSRAFCCFGVSPFMNEWISVRMTEDRGADYFKDILTTVYGTLEVGEETKDGWVLNIYRMKGEKTTANAGF